MNKIAKWTMAVAITAGSPSLMADTIYNVNFTTGYVAEYNPNPTGDSYGTESVIGTIVTDGQLGPLAASDITSFDLTISGQVSDVADSGSVYCYLSCQLSAVGATLVFSPSGGSQAYQYFDGFDPSITSGPRGGHFFQFNGDGTIDAYINNDGCIPTPGGGCGYYGTTTGVVGVIGTAVPLPPTALLLAGGLFGLASITSRRRRKLRLVRAGS